MHWKFLNDHYRIRMRILYVISYYKPAYVYGGPAKSVPALCEGLVKLGAGVSVFTTNANGNGHLSVPLHTPIDVDGVSVSYFPLAMGGMNFYSPQLGAVIRSQAGYFDLIVAEGIWEYALSPVVWAGLRYHVPFIITVRGQLFPWSLKKGFLKKQLFMFLFAHRYIDNAAGLQVSDNVEAKAVARFGWKTPIFIVPNGLDLSCYQNLPARGHLRSKLGIAENQKLLLFLGRLNHIKRPDIAIYSLAFAKKQGFQVSLVLAGPDEDGLTRNLIEFAKKNDCSENVYFTGLLTGDQILEALADADLLLMPSEVQESFGMATVEAMAAGLPVLVSEGVPAGYWAERAGAGKVVPCDRQCFAQSTCELLSSQGTMIEMGKQGRELANSRFEIRRVAEKMLDQFQSIVDTGRPIFETEYSISTLQ